MAIAGASLYRRILLPTDFSRASAEALVRGVALAVRHGAKLRVFHATMYEKERQLEHAHHEETLAMIERLQAHGRSFPLHKDASFEFVSRDGESAAHAIDAELEAFGPDLVVMATHGGGLLTESLAEHVVATAPCSMLTCRLGAASRWPSTPGRIVVPVDFSPDARAALAMARALVGTGTITLLHAVDPALQTMDADEQGRLQAKLHAWANGPVDEAIVRAGNPRDVVIDASRGQDVALVVVGTRAVHTLHERMAGTMAATLATKSHAPVLTVR